MHFRPMMILIGLVSLIFASSAFGGELDGRWRRGFWTDANTGHEDALRGRFRQQSDGNYRVVFTGRFAKIVPFRFATTLNVVGHDGDKVIMSGESRLMGFGRFSYDAVADGNSFQAQYSSRRWRGEFHLWR